MTHQAVNPQKIKVYMMKNKYTNKALKNGNIHYHDYSNGLGYIKTVKPLTFKTIMQCLFCFIVIAIITFYLITK